MKPEGKQMDEKQQLQQGLQANLDNYEKVKFTFDGLDKYIVMVLFLNKFKKQLNTKIALEDLKFTFSSILKIDFFARRLEFYIQNKFNSINIQLNSQQPLQQQKFDAGKCKEKLKEYQIQVKFIEEGA